MMLDFAAVSGLDFSAVNAMGRFLQAANASGVRIVLSALSEGLKDRFERGLPAAVYRELLWEPDADRGLDRCEDLLIETWNTESVGPGERRDSLLEHSAEALEHYLERQIDFESLMESLQGWLNPSTYEKGAVLDLYRYMLAGRLRSERESGASLTDPEKK